MRISLGDVEAGSETGIVAVLHGPSYAPTAQSTAITFTLHMPDGTQDVKTDADPEVVGPTTGSVVVDGVTYTTTTWIYTTPVLTQSGHYQVAAKSTAGIKRASRSGFVVPEFAPFATP
jgi:hypothetical protein